MTKSLTTNMAVLLVLVFTGAALSSDIIPPAWRGGPGTTFQEWGFDTNANPAAPTASNNPYGNATAAVTVGSFGSGWLDQLPGMGTQTGYWDLGGEGGQIVLDIANRPQALPYKEVWVQVTYFRDLTQAPSVSVPGAQFVSGQTLTLEAVQTGGSWLVDQSLWRIEPNPSSEQVIITSNPAWGGVVDQIVVDTICAPEPASLALLGLMGAFLIGRRR